MEKIELEEVKRRELDLLINFKKLCEYNDLYYTLAGGTLLGAIRHKGFIPWDDDIDVMMPSPDYERILNNDIDTSILPDYIKIISWKRGNLCFPFIKMIDMRTKIDTKFYDAKICDDHIWIDIFALDGNSDDDDKTRRLYRKSTKLREKIFIRIADVSKGKSTIKKAIKPVVTKCANIVLPINELCERIDSNAKMYGFNDGKFIGGVLWGYGIGEKIDRVNYMKPIEVEFEGHIFNAPSNYDEYLSGIYGDYMVLPPENKRVVHGVEAWIMDGEKLNE